MIEQLSVQYGVKDCCAALRVSRSGFYRWKSAQETKRAKEQRELVSFAFGLERTVVRDVDCRAVLFQKSA
jgi:hypothetical protein